jgi:hypothetical protein
MFNEDATSSCTSKHIFERSGKLLDFRSSPVPSDDIDDDADDDDDDVDGVGNGGLT